MIGVVLRFWQPALGAIVGGFIGFQAGKIAGHSAGVKAERIAAQARTEAAINEVQDQAERARAQRRLCVDGGGVWDHARLRCEQKATHE
jgi:uncharacterized protein YcfJ